MRAGRDFTLPLYSGSRDVDPAILEMAVGAPAAILDAGLGRIAIELIAAGLTSIVGSHPISVKLADLARDDLVGMDVLLRSRPCQRIEQQQGKE
jgi:hypothetical protein